MHVFSSYVHSINNTYAYSRYDRTIKFRIVSVQHFINEAPDVWVTSNGQFHGT